MKIQLLILVLILTSIVEAQKPSSSDDGDAWEATNANVSPSMAIVVIVLVLGFFITGCIFIYIQHCVVDSSSTITTTTTNNNNNLIKRGLDQSVIDTFPQFKYSAVKELKIGKGALECAVCLSEFDNEQTLLRLLPKCDHVFHSECIDSWLVGHATCPVCRDNLLAVAVPEETPNDEVQITISDQETTTDNKKRVRLARSHSTGHSMVRQVENSERYTLRLPAEVRRQLMARAHLHATSMVALPRQSSSRRGYRASAGGDGSGSSRYGRFFGRSFILRMGSFKSTTAKVVDHGDFTNTCSAAVATPPQINASFPPPLPL